MHSMAVYVIVLVTATLLSYSVFSSLHFIRLRVMNFILDKNYSTTSEEEEININLFQDVPTTQSFMFYYCGKVTRSYVPK